MRSLVTKSAELHFLDAPGNANSEVLQRELYYPFGLQLHGTAPLNPSPNQNYLYNGKEQMEGTGLYNYGARYYDPTIARWTGVDPLADQFGAWSPYNYVLNNPLLLIDPDGRAPVWKPRVVNGEIQLVKEKGDDLKSLHRFLGGSSRFSYDQVKQLYNSARGGVIVDLPEDNYSRAFEYAEENPNVFSNEQRLDVQTNYNCYHFCINGVWEKEIYTPESFGQNILGPPGRVQSILNNYFKEVDVKDAAYGETIIAMNYSGGVPQHTAVYAGQDKEGNIYIFNKQGGSESPQLQRLDDMIWSDYRFFNEKTGRGDEE